MTTTTTSTPPSVVKRKFSSRSRDSDEPCVLRKSPQLLAKDYYESDCQIIEPPTHADIVPTNHPTNINSTTTSPQLSALSLGNNSTTPLTTAATSIIPLERAVVTRRSRRIYNSNLAKASFMRGKIRKKLQVEKYGQCVLHPLKLQKVKLNKGMVIGKSKDLFLEAFDAFICHYAEYNCRNYQRRSHVTQ